MINFKNMEQTNEQNVRLDDVWLTTDSQIVLYTIYRVAKLVFLCLQVPGFDDYITITVTLTNQKFLWNVNVLR